MPWADDRALWRNAVWTEALRKLQIPYRRPYNMRPTYATAMLMAGMNPVFCAGQLGHSVALFLTTYATWINGERDAPEMKWLIDYRKSKLLPSNEIFRPCPESRH